MSENRTDRGRRRFLRGAVAGVIAAPAAGLLATRGAAAAEQPKLDPSDPQASALNYVHDASEAADHSAYKEGADCANCLHWTGGDAEWGGCNIFRGKLVHRDGWCTAWAARG